ncbi:hypothetical protein [Perlabentimonas gracilis]|uniref:hypothetical protein n=1 Tax=Perlabentimonas gracilis TaxID=2715279 RepID=UPI0014087205|nr:hypothetical protein [Perlabentimonas gracilis]NHB67639.1 hypothetical protein [Perlabentimonas gracilis]
MSRIKSFTSVAIITLVTAVLTVFSGCSKDEGLVPDAQMDEKEMLVLKDYEEYSSALNKVLTLDEDELRLWEEQQGFKSFGRMCDEMYENVKQKDFTTIEGLMEFVNNNNRFLKLEKMESGDYVLEVALEKHSNRYLLNRDMMYAIGGTAYKVFEEGVASISVQNKEILKNAQTLKEVEACMSSKQNDSKNNYDISVKNIYGPGTFFATKWEEIGRDAVKTTISLDYQHRTELADPMDSNSSVPVTYRYNIVKVRGYEKKLWWSYAKVSISGKFKVRALYNGVPEYHYWDFPKDYCRIHEQIIKGGRVGYGSFIPDQTVDAYYMWGKNHKGVEATRSLNPHLLL